MTADVEREPADADKICRPLRASPSVWAFIVAIIVFGLTLVISILVLFRYGMRDNQSLPPSTAAETTFTVGTLIAFTIAASHWLPQLGW
jgi:Ni/Fe-hydrogenase subunit HybB-like protein